MGSAAQVAEADDAEPARGIGGASPVPPAEVALDGDEQAAITHPASTAHTAVSRPEVRAARIRGHRGVGRDCATGALTSE